VKYQIPPEVLAAWNQGDEIEAIRALRGRTGLGLKEAKAALESGEYSVAVSPPMHGAALPPAVLSAMARGDKIEAIKLTREATGLGLKEAKDAVEAAATGAPASVHKSSNHLAPGEVPRSRINWVAIASLLGFALVLVLLAPRLLGT
jgi:ribosomal protein L7/L12